MNEQMDSFVKFIKESFSDDDIKVAKFIYELNLLSYSMITEKVREGEKIVEKPTNILELSYLKLCDKKFDDSKDLLEKMFLFYIGYSLKEYKSILRLNLNNLEREFKYKCSYCNIKSETCPFKLVGYIKKCIDDNHFDADKVLDLLVSNNKVYKNDPEMIKNVGDRINSLSENINDIFSAEMLLSAGAFEIEKVENGIIYYKYIDFNSIYNNSFFNNLNDFFKSKKGLSGEISVSDVKIEKADSYLFDMSPIEISVYLKYLCEINNLDYKRVINYISEKRNFKEIAYNDIYYKQYIHSINELECSENEKNEIISILTYIRNYYFNESLPYIHFNIGLFTKNSVISDKIVTVINRFARTFNYIGNKGTILVDTEMLVKRTKDSTDMIMQMDKIYMDNDVVIFNNLSKIKNLNEYRVDAFFTSFEKFNMRNKQSITFFIEEEAVFKDITQKHFDIFNTIINKKIKIEELSIEQIKSKLLEKLSKVLKIDEEFEKSIEEYISNSYKSCNMDEYSYIDYLYQQIVFNKFKILNSSTEFEKVDVPQDTETRSVEEILNDINSLVGLADVKENIKEFIKYIDYSKKIDTEGFANLNMIFKGNSGTGKTTVARLLAELFYKLGFIKENKIIEVTSKDLIGSHLGETAPKTQMVIDSALDGVLLIDEAYTIMSSKGGTSSNYSLECMATISKAMELYKDRLVIIFAGYTKEMNDFINSNQGLMSRIGYEIEFSDFSKEELLQIFKEEAEGNEFELEDGVMQKVEKIIIKNKIGRNFGNARFVRSLFDKLVLVHSANYTDEKLLKTITKRDVEILEETKKDKTRTIDDILKDLNSLIGIQNVKDTINGFVSVIELNKKLDRTPDFNMHMIFKGNAGTGKTTVARLLAEIYYNLGYVKRNKLVEVQSQDLIGEFLGQTGPKTQAVIESALDGVLFIDEAYSIMEHGGQNASYSAECVATLLKAMEDYQGRLIIIFAGYTEEMKKFRDLNPGLKSRIGYEIDYGDYTLEELMQIFDKKIAEKGFKIDKDAKKKVEDIMRKAMNVENFGNGRFVENTVQKIIIEHAIKTRSCTDTERLLTFTEEDIADIKAEESRKRIGF